MDKRTREYKESVKVVPKEDTIVLKELTISDPSIHKTEVFNGEVAPEFKEKGLMSQWSDEEKIQSMINTCRILPGNMRKEGRHTKENIQALNVFRVTDELIDKVYSNHHHDDFGQLVKFKEA